MFLKDFSSNFPQRCILTDDPLRARMLIAHHLEYAAPVYEDGDVFIYSGSYKGFDIALISTGFSSAAPFIDEIKSSGVSELLYIGDCSSVRHPLRTVILNGDDTLITRAKREAKNIDIPVSVCDSFTAPYATELQEYANSRTLNVLSILTVSKNTGTEEEMEEHERRSRPYVASRLAFEVFGNK